MGRTAFCCDNAAAECYFHSRKVEWLHGREIEERQVVRTLVLECIEGYYNRSRRHSALGYLSHCELERRPRRAGTMHNPGAQRSDRRMKGPQVYQQRRHPQAQLYCGSQVTVSAPPGSSLQLARGQYTGRMTGLANNTNQVSDFRGDQ